MAHIRTTYLDFLHHGVVATAPREVESQNPENVELPDDGDIFGFTFFDVLSETVIEGGQEVLLTSDPINLSRRHFVGGTLHTLEELQALPDTDNLVANISGSQYSHAVLCPSGLWELFSSKTDIFHRQLLVA